MAVQESVREGVVDVVNVAMNGEGGGGGGEAWGGWWVFEVEEVEEEEHVTSVLRCGNQNPVVLYVAFLGGSAYV